jgi:hypothetical protein
MDKCVKLQWICVPGSLNGRKLDVTIVPSWLIVNPDPKPVPLPEFLGAELFRCVRDWPRLLRNPKVTWKVNAGHYKDLPTQRETLPSLAKGAEPSTESEMAQTLWESLINTGTLVEGTTTSKSSTGLNSPPAGPDPDHNGPFATTDMTTSSFQAETEPLVSSMKTTELTRIMEQTFNTLTGRAVRTIVELPKAGPTVAPEPLIAGIGMTANVIKPFALSASPSTPAQDRERERLFRQAGSGSSLFSAMVLGSGQENFGLRNETHDALQRLDNDIPPLTPEEQIRDPVTKYFLKHALPTWPRECDVYFVDRWAGLRNYPTLARALGLLIDLTVDVPVESPVDTSDLLRPGTRFELSPSASIPEFPESRDIVPRRTSCVVSSPKPVRVLPLSDGSCADCLPASTNGVLRPCGTDGFSLASMNVDDAVHKVRASAEASRGAIEAAVPDPDSARVGGTTTWGLALQYGREEQYIDAKKKRNAKTCEVTDTPLFAEDLRIGYRFDVRRVDGKPSEWAALCDRVVTYHRGFDLDDEKAEELCSDSGRGQRDREREEGIVRRTARVAKAATAQPTQELVHRDEWFIWNDWPLAVPVPPAPDDDYHRRPDPTAEEAAERAKKCVFSLAFHQRVEVRDGSQLPLRFGHQYEVMGREVYLDGSGPTLADLKDLLGSENVTRVQDDACGLFEREEPKTPPQLHLSEPLDPDWVPGEQLQEVIVRSARRRHLQIRRNSRWVVPPRVPIQFAALHDEAHALNGERLPAGMMQDVVLTPEGAVPSVNWLTTTKIRLPQRRYSRGSSTDSPQASTPTDTSEEGHRAATILIVDEDRDPVLREYYPDPWVERIQIGLPVDRDSCFGNRIGEFEVYERGRRWPEGGYFRIDAYAVEQIPRTGRASWKRGLFGRGPRVLRIAVAPGEDLTVKLWSARSAPPSAQPSAHAMGHAPTRRLHACLEEARAHLNSAGPNGSRKAEILDYVMRDCGRTAWPRINPAQELRLIHAVEQPLGGVPCFDKPEPCQRVAVGQTKAVFGGGILADRRTTGQLECFAQWTDLLDIDQQPLGPARRTCPPESVFRLVETDFNRSRGNPIRISLLANSEEETSDLELKSPIEHDFKDCKHRIVTYWLESRSFFESYFPKDQREGCLLSGREYAIPVSIKASRAPDPPSIQYLVPLFETSITRSAVELETRRFARRIRVWINAPFFSSGEGQELAVVCWPGDLANSRGRRPASGTIPESIRPFITRIGDDPLSPGSRTLELIPGDFFWAPARVVNDVKFPGAVSEQTTFGLEETKKEDQPPAQKPPTVQDPTTVVAADTDVRVTLFTYPVDCETYDPERKQYFCDIQINPDVLWPDQRFRASYPYVRFAFSAYQPHALPGVHLSSIVVADFYQLQSERSALVTRDPLDSHRRCVAISGYGHADFLAQNNGERRLMIKVRLLHREHADDAPTVREQFSPRIEEVGPDYQVRIEFEQHGHMELVVEEYFALPRYPDSREDHVDLSPANRAEHKPLFLKIPLMS